MRLTYKRGVPVLELEGRTLRGIERLACYRRVYHNTTFLHPRQVYVEKWKMDDGSVIQISRRPLRSWRLESHLSPTLLGLAS